MNILMIGYGKMGKEIELQAISRGHAMPYKINIDNTEDLDKLKGEDVDVAIELSLIHI